MPSDRQLRLSPLDSQVLEVVCLNSGQQVAYSQKEEFVLDLSAIEEDEIATILKSRLDRPLSGRPIFSRMDLSNGNLACGGRARFRSIDGLRPLPPPTSFHLPRYGVDGQIWTEAAAALEYAWNYEVDLTHPAEVDRIVVTFPVSGYATVYRILVSSDKDSWEVVDTEEQGQPGRAEFRFEPKKATKVPVSALKPDGPDEVGWAMMIRELEVYAAKRGQPAEN